MQVKFKTDKHFIHAVMYDIFNWGFNITSVMFVWGISHLYAEVLVGLFLLRFAANYSYKLSIYREQKTWQENARKNMEDFTKKLKEENNRTAHISTPLHETIDDVEDEIITKTNKKDILQ